MKRFFSTVIIYLIVVRLLSAQDIPYINYTTHNGLPQIQVQELFQDSKGYIWVGTKGGLAKFNGEEFEHLLYNQYIYGIDESPSGTMYFLTLDSLYKQTRGKLQAIDAVGSRAYLEVGGNSVWVNTVNQLKEYRGDTLYNVIKKGVNIFDDFYMGVYDNENNQLLFSTVNTHTVYALSDKKLTEIERFKVPVLVEEFSDGTIFYALHPQRNEELADNRHKENEELAVNRQTKAVYYHYVSTPKKIKILEMNKMPVRKHCISCFRDNWFNFFLLDTLTQDCKAVKFPIDEEVYALLFDRDGNYWAGTDNGLYQFNNKSFRVYPRTFMNDFWTIIKGDNGKYYGGQFKGGLFELDLKNERKREIKVKGVKLAVEKDYYYGSSKDKKGNLYFPTHYGLVKYDYNKAKQFDTGISLISKYDTLENKIVFGQHHGIGFIDEQEHITVVSDSTKKLITFHPSSLAFQNNGNIFIGNRAGLVIFNRRTRTFESVCNNYENCPRQNIISMTTDHRKNIWIGGKSQLWLYDSTKDAFAHIGKDFFTTGILSLLSPDSTLLLIGTSYEIFAMRLDKFYNEGKVEFKMFNYRNGFFSEEVAQNGFFLDEDKVLIPSSTSTTVLNHREIFFQPEFFDVFITKINSEGLSLKEQTNTEPFEVNRGERRVYIDFEAVGFGLPTKSRFKYKLEGVDKTWSKWSENKKIHYTGLGSGKYVFHVVAQNGSNIEPLQEKMATVSFLISLPFYKEPHFFQYAFFFFLFLASLVAYFFWRAYKNRIEVQSRERRIKLLEIATLQAQINPHFIFNFLSSIQSLISQKAPEKANDYLVKFSRLIRSYMESSIKSSKILSGAAGGNENTIKEEIDLLRTYIELERLKYVEGKINYKIELEEDSILNKTIPPMMLQPFVENAIKHGILPKEDNGTVTISFTHDEHALVCTIKDDGIGRALSAEIGEQSIPAYKSRGLQLIKNRVELLNKLDYKININFEDPKEGGTVVIIHISN